MSGMLVSGGRQALSEDSKTALRDEEFKASVAGFLAEYGKPDIDFIAVTRGPGLEPALWTGITFAEALGATWNIPVMGVDHMEGHLVSALLKQKIRDEKLESRVLDSELWTLDSKLTPDSGLWTLDSVKLPLLTLLISGGHTELLLMKGWFDFETVGETKDDAIGEAFDKVARLLDLSYPGGPRIAELAAKSRGRGENPITFPRPMAHDETCDFSFSGLKTAVLYKLRSMEKLSETDKENIAEEFENAARDVLVIKARRGLKQTGARTLALGGGVSANVEIRNAFVKLMSEHFPEVALRFPHESMTGDNAIMIGAAGYLRHVSGTGVFEKKIAASGNLKRGAR